MQWAVVRHFLEIAVLFCFFKQSLSNCFALQNTVTSLILGLLIFDLTKSHELNQFPQNCKSSVLLAIFLFHILRPKESDGVHVCVSF